MFYANYDIYLFISCYICIELNCMLENHVLFTCIGLYVIFLACSNMPRINSGILLNFRGEIHVMKFIWLDRSFRDDFNHILCIFFGDPCDFI